jgi:hypothetical protein
MLEKLDLHHSQNKNKKTMKSSNCTLKINQAIKIKT